MEPVAEADALQYPPGQLVIAHELRHQTHILQSRERRDEVEHLEHEAHSLAAVQRELRIIHAVEPAAEDRESAAGGGVEAPGQVQQGRLA